MSKGGQSEVVRGRFSIVGTFSLGSLVKKPRDRSLIPQYQFNKIKQHTVSREVISGGDTENQNGFLAKVLLGYDLTVARIWKT